MLLEKRETDLKSCLIQKREKEKEEEPEIIPIKVNNIKVKEENKETPILTPFHFTVYFTCSQILKQDIEWSVIYVGNAEDENYDQLLDVVEVGPISHLGDYQFELEVPAPNFHLIPKEEHLGITCILILGKYNKQEFIRVGYYLKNEYWIEEEEEEKEVEKEKEQDLYYLNKIKRSILTDMPRVTTFSIYWDDIPILPSLKF